MPDVSGLRLKDEQTNHIETALSARVAGLSGSRYQKTRSLALKNMMLRPENNDFQLEPLQDSPGPGGLDHDFSPLVSVKRLQADAASKLPPVFGG